MSVLKYKTRADSKPQGKPKVYFCCHEEDFNLYFEEISDDILSKQNCSIWYLDDFADDYYELFFEDLKQMQLFVMPVTSKLLLTDNRALNTEFAFAIDNHIPVLPLMQEAGLEELFNQKCGELQFLDKNKIDDTSIKFDKKLEDYLSAVLIGEELAEKIRAAFDAYIFLSYRKKDRMYANELMRLIHKNDFCRDIAIWYDEFLTPGEDFNASIKAALDKSGLFVLTVTPNIVNEKNYIMTTEYPNAKDIGKPILPIEIVPTDKTELIKKYEGIPECTDAHNSKQLTESLLKSIKEIALKENEKTPEHNFFIVLAYLNGIDVETDHSKAINLITNAADQGLSEAMEKLAEMYMLGIAVKCDYNKAAYWLEKVVRIKESIYSKENSEDNTNSLFDSLYKLSKVYEKLHNLDKAEELYGEMIKLCDETAKDIVTGSKFSLIFSALSEIYKNKGDYESSLEVNKKCIYVREDILSVADAIGEKLNLSVNYTRQGRIYFLNDMYDEAIKSFEQSLSIRKNILTERGELDDEYGIALNILNLGDVYTKKEEFEPAESNYLKSLEIINKLLVLSAKYEYQHQLAINLERLGSLYRNFKRFDEAREYLLKGLKTVKSLAEKTNLPAHKRTLAVNYQRIATVAELEDNFEEAKQYYFSCLEINEELLNNAKTFEAVEDYSIDCARIARLHKKYGDMQTAFDYFQKSLEVCINNVSSPPVTEEKVRICMYCNELANVCRIVGEYDLAKEFVEESLKYGEEIVNQAGYLRLKRQISNSYEVLGDINSNLHNFEESKRFWNKKIELDRKLVFESKNDPGDLQLLSIGITAMGDIYLAEKNFDSAKACYEESLQIKEMLTNGIDVDYIIEYEKIGDLYFEQNLFDVAEKFYMQSLEGAKSINEKQSNLANQRRLSVVYNKLAGLYRFSGDIDKAREYILEDLQISHNLANTLRTPESYDDLAMTLYSFALLEDGRIALEPLQDAYDIWCRLSEKFPNVSRYLQCRNDAKQILDFYIE